MIRWERLGALGVPAVVIAALCCLVRGAWLFGEPFGWLAGFVALLFIAFVMDRGGESEQEAADGGQVTPIGTAQTQRIGAIR